MNTDFEKNSDSYAIENGFNNSHHSDGTEANIKEMNDSNATGLAEVFENRNWHMALALYEHRHPGQALIDNSMSDANSLDVIPHIYGNERGLSMNTDIERDSDGIPMTDGFANTQPLTQPAKTINSIEIDSLNPCDEITLFTGSSQYKFMVTDSAHLTGLLTGGQIGNETVEANLLAVQDDNGFRLNGDFSVLRKGMRVIFHIAAGERNLITSFVRQLFITRNRG